MEVNYPGLGIVPILGARREGNLLTVQLDVSGLKEAPKKAESGPKEVKDPLLEALRTLKVDIKDLIEKAELGDDQHWSAYVKLVNAFHPKVVPPIEVIASKIATLASAPDGGWRENDCDILLGLLLFRCEMDGLSPTQAGAMEAIHLFGSMGFYLEGTTVREAEVKAREELAYVLSYTRFESCWWAR